MSTHLLPCRSVSPRRREGVDFALVRDAYERWQRTGCLDGVPGTIANAVLRFEEIYERLEASAPSPSPRDALLTEAERRARYAALARTQAIARRNPLLADLIDPQWPPVEFPPDLDPYPVDCWRSQDRLL